MRILHVIRQGSFGGGESYLFRLVSGLKKYNCNIEVLSFSYGNLINELEKVKIKAHVIETTHPFDFRIFLKVFKFLKSYKFDLVHIHGSRAASNIVVSCILSKTPYIYTVHGWSFHSGLSKIALKLRKSAEKYFIKYSESTVCVSAANLKIGEELFEASKLKLIRNGIDTCIFNPSTIQKEYLQTTSGLSISADDFVVAFIGRITYQKDPLTFIRAIEILKSKIPQLKVLFIGDGELKAESLKMIGTYNLKEIFSIQNFTNNVREILAITNIFVLPSLWEGLSLSLMESMSMQNVCIASDIPANSEIIKDGQNGFIFPVGDFSKLADIIFSVYKDRALQIHIGNQARNSIINNFEFSKVINQNIELYENVTNKLVKINQY